MLAGIPLEGKNNSKDAKHDPFDINNFGFDSKSNLEMIGSPRSSDIKVTILPDGSK